MPPPLTYTCVDGRTLTVTFGETANGWPQAIIHHTDGDLVLPQVITASGARYYAAPVELHTLSTTTAAARRCTAPVPPGCNQQLHY